ncbi:MAG: Stk1 family PASTA domain-containing Ser/Thr kinase [Rubrobacteraceae bacterium]|nr:Stk1 family PASTA domain-containing Ser/Thr kinase [Rubrobacteraceae bacterium]
MQQTVLGDRYTLLEVLGDGGMARVYLARDNVLDREVALKVLRDQYGYDEALVERFRREARNAASLNHPNIVQVYDQGRDDDGTYYIAMEYVPGDTLKDLMAKEGSLAPKEAAGIASRVAVALEVAHGRGIVHRDIKPQNVLLSASGEPKVADFGIARAASSKTMTETNLILGTAAYMSPEQVKGEPVGPASDLYSLGVVLYEMLTGRRPYEAEDPIATAMKHINAPAPHPREANPAVPEDVDALVVRLLAKAPEDRYASAAELAEDLRRVRDGLPPPAAGLVDRTTARLPQDTGETRTPPTAVAPGRGSRPPASPGARRRALSPLLALLLGVALLGGLAWALTRSPTEQGTPGTGGVGPVAVPNVVGLPRVEATKRLDGVGLKPGSEGEAANDEFAEGVVIEQDPEAGSEVERGTTVDLVVSTGPAQEPTPTASPSASPAASPTATATATASPASNAEAKDRREERQKEAEEAAEERRKEQEKAAKELEKELKEAREKARKD